MREQVASLLEAQLDYIFFSYGLAFILLGAVCISIARTPVGKAAGVALLGLFGIVHGIAEWMDLTAILIHDTPLFAAIRTATMTISFLFLLEFSRLGGIRFGLRLPGQWIYLPLLTTIALVGFYGGLASANASARYTIGLVGTIGTALVMLRHARRFSPETRRLAILTAAVFVVYGITAGAIVPAAPFWPADAINQAWFIQLTGVPIQLVRGLLACTLAVLIWSIWGQLLAAAVDSSRYTAHLRKQFIGTLAALAAIFVCGWVLTDFLGGIYRQNIQDEAHGDIELVSGRLAGETASVQGMVKALAGSPIALWLLDGGDAGERGRAQFVLNLQVRASGASLGYILDTAGTVVASSSREFALLGAPNERAAPYFQQSLAGMTGHHYAVDRVSGSRTYLTSFPIRAADDAIVGVAVLQKSLDALEVKFGQFDRSFYLVDSAGVVILTNRSDDFARSLWPSSNKTAQTLAEQFGSPARTAVLQREVAESAWTSIEGRRGFVLRKPVVDSEWSLVVATPISGMFASRFLGIILTLQFAITALFYFFGRERGIRESIQLEKRLELQSEAESLKIRASTDRLTGLFNRLKFDEALGQEIARSERYRTPFALVLYDVDHFKEVNDVYGHQMGDRVLVQLSEIVARGIRQMDFLARWGGEEFVILFPGSSCETAGMAADKLRVAIAQTGFDQVGSISCSFGVAEFAEGDTAESLIARADNALYRAKMNGRNRVELDLPVVEQIDMSPVEVDDRPIRKAAPFV